MLKPEAASSSKLSYTKRSSLWPCRASDRRHVIPMSSRASTRQNRLAYRRSETPRINQIAMAVTSHHPVKRFRFPLALPIPRSLTARRTAQDSTRTVARQSRGNVRPTLRQQRAPMPDQFALRDCGREADSSFPKTDNSSILRVADHPTGAVSQAPVVVVTNQGHGGGRQDSRTNVTDVQA
jgi:hypothetical protein